MTVYEALLRVRADVGSIAKGDRNDRQNFLFRGVDRVLNKVGPALMNHGVNCYPELRSLESRDITTTSKGTRQREITVQVAYHYVGPEGDEIVALVAGEAADSGDKAVSKAMSVALRTAHIQTLQIPTGDIDPDSHTVVRATDPLLAVKNDIWAEADKRGWIDGDQYDLLQEDFATWSEGGDIASAEEKTLKQYLTHLRPKRTMRRDQA